ncbi:MAG: tetratricopeptide repeat protein [Thermodesulfobacteriota bacterium]
MLCSVIVGGCLTRPGGPQLPYVKPAQQPANTDPARERLAARLEALETELQRLRDMVERLQASGGGDPQAVPDLQRRVAAIERRLGGAPPGEVSKPHLPSASGEGPSEASSSRPVEAPEAEPPRPSAPLTTGMEPRIEIAGTPRSEDEKAFLAAFAPVEARASDKAAWDKAIPLLEQFLKDHPKSRFAANAHYWLGEAFLAKSRFGEAILEFDRVIKDYPNSTNELNAMFKQAEAFKAKGEPSSARIIFEKIVREHPHTHQAREARKILKRLPQGKPE